MILEMDFADMKAIEECMASKIRPESQVATEKVMLTAALREKRCPASFDGRFYHLVAEATVLTPDA